MNDRFIYSNFAEVFGELQSVRRVQRSKFQTFVIPAVLFFLVLFGVVIYVASEDWLSIPVCVLPFLLMFAGVVRNLCRTRKDELRIYENGFTYRSRKKLSACRWDEIKLCRFRRPNELEMAAGETCEPPLRSVEKMNGEIIVFDPDLQGTAEIQRLAGRR